MNAENNIIDLLNAVPIELESGGTLYKEGDENDFVYFIKSGIIRISHNDFTIGIIQPSEFIGIISLLNDRNTYRFSAFAVTDSTLLKIKKEDFNNLLLSNQTFASQIINLLCKRNRIIDTRILNRLKNSPRKRLVGEIIANANEEGESLLVFLGKRELAEIAGIDDMELNTILSELSDRDLITLENESQIKIIDFEELNRMFGVDENW